MDAGELDEGAALFDFLDELARDRARELERPLAHYLARSPGHEAAIAREWLALGADAPAADAAPAEDGRRVGPWRLVRELGRGGQGAVWLAEDTRIDRRAALKLLPEAFALLEADRRARLRREAEALARLEHPAICPVLEAQIEGDTPWLAMRLVEGETLATAIARAREGRTGTAPLPLRPARRSELERVLAFFEEAARALHAAHEAGVVHRDVKPGNIMVTPAGAPVLLDFGQARDESATLAARTLSGDVFGTPAYMSPEQVRGRTHEVDRRTDVWSLGATLVEALTLERPFEGASVAELALAVDRAPLPPLREHGLPRDLCAVLETALERDLARRYATALDLAEDLRRVREHEPVRARPAGPLLRLSRWARRHPAVATSLAAVLLGLSAGLAWTLHLLAREQQALDWALGSHLAKRTLALVDEDPSAALALGIEAVELAPNYETRSALLAALDACSLESLIESESARRLLDLAPSPDGRLVAAGTDVGTLVLHDLEARRRLGELNVGQGAVRAVAWLPGGELVSAGEDGRVRWWDVAARRVVREVAGPGGAILDLAVDPAGDLLALTTAEGHVALLDSGDGTTSALLGPLDGPPDTLGFDADGGRLLAFRRALPGRPAPAEAKAFVVDVGRGRVVRELGAEGEGLTWAAFVPRRSAVAIASLGGSVRVVSLADGALLAGPLELPDAAWCVAAAPDGSRLVVACEAGDEDEPARAWLWDPDDDRRIALVGHEQARVVHVAFSHDGTHVATSSFDSTVRVFDALDGRPRQTLRGFVQPLESVWSLDGARLVTLGNGGSAPVWFARGRPDVYPLVGHTGPVTSARFAPDGTRAVTASEDGTVRLWSTAAERGEGVVLTLSEPPVREDIPQGAAFCAAQTHVLMWFGSGSIRTWDLETGLENGHGGASRGLRCVETGPDARFRVQVWADGRAWLEQCWFAEGSSLRGGQLLGEVHGASSATFSPDGGHVAVGTASGELLLYEVPAESAGAEPGKRSSAPVATWSPEVEPGVDAGVVDLVFSPDGGALALACADRKVRFLRVGPTLEVLRPPLVVFPPLSIDWSADGSRLLVVGREGGGAFRLHDLVNDRQVSLEVFHAGNLTCGEFSPDGELVLSGSLDGTVYVRSSLDGTPVARLVGHAGAVLDASFSRDDGPLRVITASADGTARVWPVRPLAPALARKPRELKEWERRREARLAEPLRFR